MTTDDDSWLARKISKRIARHGYDLIDAISKIHSSVSDVNSKFAEELSNAATESYERLVVEPIRKLLPKLHDALFRD